MIFSKKNEKNAGSEGKEAMMPQANAIELLKKDHRTVSALFKQFEETEEDDEKVALAQQICTELSIHAEAEEKIFYPAAREALDEESEDLVDEAAVEHRSLKMLIAEIDGSSPDDQLFDANVKVLKEYVEHHVKEEEQEMFPKLKGSKMDLDAVGAQLAEMKEDIKAKMGEPKTPRAGAKPTVHVPALKGKSQASSKSTSSKASTGSTASSASAASGAKKSGSARSSSNGTRSASRSHSAH